MNTPDYANLTARPAHPIRLGSTPDEAGVSFAIVCNSASRAWLALFEDENDVQPVREFELSPQEHRTGGVWSIHVDGLGNNALYLYRFDGPAHDPARYVVDPYAHVLAGDIGAGRAKCVAISNPPATRRAPSPRIPFTQTLIYETHVRGFSIHQSSGAARPGTYEALAGKTSYLKALGVTAVELLPVQECGEVALPRSHPGAGAPLTNYWGYNPILFAAPARRYACGSSLEAPLAEFANMTSALHDAGIEVILDVVFNHTASPDNPDGMAGLGHIDRETYYLLDASGGHKNHSGCGNTIRCNHPVVQDLIIDSLRYWVAEFGVDGFRFDLAAAFFRDDNGRLRKQSALVRRISEDPVLRDAKLIAEPWDAGGADLTEAFVRAGWSVWNGRYRDVVRRFWRGDGDPVHEFTIRVGGSPDLFGPSARWPHDSINFVSCHDGFTLRDVVSYERKHNEANGEDNRDGWDLNFSFNCGAEGDTEDPSVNALRLRMQTNFIATLFLSLGTPMLLGGDEFGRTQRGNNNAYCQDNATSWYDWRLLDTNAELHRFVAALSAFRRSCPVFARALNGAAYPVMQWFIPSGEPVEEDAGVRAVGCHIPPEANGGQALCILFNPTEDSVGFQLPSAPWTLRVNTAAASPHDVPGEDLDSLQVSTDTYTVRRRSLAALAAPR